MDAPAMTDALRVTISVLDAADAAAAVAVINAAAAWYADFLPPDEAAGPEMSLEGWLTEGRRMTWFGAFVGDDLVGVMGSEPAADAVLLRHAYVLPGHQRRGVAAALHSHIEERLDGGTRLIVGTYRANHKARAALEKAGYHLSADSDAVLQRYFDIPGERRETSVTYEKLLPPGR